MSSRPLALNAIRPMERDIAIGPLIVDGLEGHYRLALVILGDPTLAQDATHDAVARALGSADRLRDPSRFEPWFRRILVNSCRDIQRRGVRRPTRPLTDADATRVVDDPSGRWIEQQAMAGSVDRLSHEHREVIVLRYYLDLPIAEIADALAVRQGTVRSRLHYALRRLRAELDATTRDTEGTA